MERSGITRFEQTMLPHLDSAYVLARFLVRNADDAEDLVHDAYLRALRYFASYRGGDERSWLLTIVRRTCYRWLKRQRTGPRLTEFDEYRHGATAPEASPDSAVEQAALRESLLRAVEQLPLEFREAIVLRDLQGLSYRETADVLGVPIGTVMSRLARGRRRLQSVLPIEDFRRS
jgi:RNA polymerase sigma-70 factor (ECF subfamily)